MDIHLCKNCGKEYSENFCNRCGQQTVHRISLSHIGHDAVHAILHADKGIIHLFIQLFKRPGNVAREFIIEGKRKKYFNPLQYLLIVASLATFVVLSTHLMDHLMTENPFRSGSPFSKRQTEVTGQITRFLSKYFNIVLLLQLPVFALGSFWVYRKHKLTYAEHLTLHIFLTAQMTVITMAMMLLFVNTLPVLFYIVPTIASLIYSVIAFRQFFYERSGKGTMKAVLSFAISHLLYVIFFTIFLIIAMVVIVKFRLHAT